MAKFTAEANNDNEENETPILQQQLFSYLVLLLKKMVFKMRQKLVLTQIYYYRTSFQDVKLAKGAVRGEHCQTEREQKNPITLKWKGVDLGLDTNIKKYS